MGVPVFTWKGGIWDIIKPVERNCGLKTNMGWESLCPEIFPPRELLPLSQASQDLSTWVSTTDSSQHVGLFCSFSVMALTDLHFHVTTLFYTPSRNKMSEFNRCALGCHPHLNFRSLKFVCLRINLWKVVSVNHWPMTLKEVNFNRQHLLSAYWVPGLFCPSLFCLGCCLPFTHLLNKCYIWGI